MAETGIEWTERSWNPVVGCSIKSAGCTNCYAMPRAARLAAMGVAHYQGLTRKVNGIPVWTGKLALNEKALLEPLRRKKPTIWFVNSMGDLFHEDCPDEWIDRVFAVMALCPHHTFQMLTKRSDRMREYFREVTGWRRRIAELLNELKPSPLWNGNVHQGWQNLHGTPDGLPNVWLGVSVEDQRAADECVPDLLATPAAIRWLSCEPLLGPVDLTTIVLRPFGGRPTELSQRLGDYIQPLRGNFTDSPKLDWIVAGGESGKDARPMHPDWARSLRDQCAAAGVPFFFKQWGEWLPFGALDADGHENRKTYGGKGTYWHDWKAAGGFSVKLGKKSAGRLLDGVLHDAMPSSPARGGGPAQPVEGHPRHD